MADNLVKCQLQLFPHHNYDKTAQVFSIKQSHIISVSQLIKL